MQKINTTLSLQQARKDAKALRKSDPSLSQRAALDKIARANGYMSWKNFLAVRSESAATCDDPVFVLFDTNWNDFPVEADARPWLERATPEQLKDLLDMADNDSLEADTDDMLDPDGILQTLVRADTSVAELFQSVWNEVEDDRELDLWISGRVDRDAAERWIRAHRPEIHIPGPIDDGCKWIRKVESKIDGRLGVFYTPAHPDYGKPLYEIEFLDENGAGYESRHYLSADKRDRKFEELLSMGYVEANARDR